MAMFGRKNKTTVGLDIGSGLIKVAVIDHSKRQPELVRVSVTPLLADAIVEGEVMDPGIVGEAIRTALAAAGVKTKSVVTAVGGRDVIIKKIQIERVKESQASELMRWEAEQHVPFDMESVELDFQILDPDGDGPEMSVLLVAAKRELIESKIRVLTDAGLEPRDRRGRGVRAPQCVRDESSRGAWNGVIGLLNIGHDVTNINILDDGVPLLTPRHHRRHAARSRRSAARARTLVRRRTGARAGLRPLAAPRVDPQDAAAKRSPSASSAQPAFLAQNSRAGQMRAIYTCGGGSRIPGLNDMLATRLKSDGSARRIRSPISRSATALSRSSSPTKSRRC